MWLRVAHGGCNVGMSENLLNILDRHAAVIQPRREAVPHAVEPNTHSRPAAKRSAAGSALWRRSIATNASGMGTAREVLVFVSSMLHLVPCPFAAPVGFSRMIACRISSSRVSKFTLGHVSPLISDGRAPVHNNVAMQVPTRLSGQTANNTAACTALKIARCFVYLPDTGIRAPSVAALDIAVPDLSAEISELRKRIEALDTRPHST